MRSYYVILIIGLALTLGCAGNENKSQIKGCHTCQVPPSMEDIFDKSKEVNNRCLLFSFFDEPCIREEDNPNNQTVRFSIYNSFSNTFIVRIDKSDICQRLVVKEIPSVFFNLIYFSEGKDLVNYKTYSCNIDEAYWNKIIQFLSNKEKQINDQLYIDGSHCYIELKTKTQYLCVTKTIPFSNNLIDLEILLNKIVKHIQDNPNNSISSNIDSL